MERPEQVRLSEILISTQKTPPVKTEKGETALPETPSPEVVAEAQAKADQVYAMLQEGRQVRRLGQAVFQRPDLRPSAATWNISSAGTLSKELEQKVFAMQAGQYTEPIRTNQGFVILKVTEHQTAGVPPLKEVESRSRNSFT